jgi:CsoR family transcriptional regulator, copper-sensing transcriptional repressor
MNDKEHHENKSKSSLSIKKSVGITNKVLKMIEKDEYCPDIIQQINAAIGLLEASKKRLVRGHLNHCLEDNLERNRTKAIEELVKIFDLK